MKKNSLVIYGLLILLLLPCGVYASGNISVSSSPSGAQILLDSIDKGVTPNTLGNVTSGSYNILLQKSGYQNNLSSVTVVDGETVTLSIILIPSVTAPTITTLSPTSAANSGSQTIEIVGTGFSGSTVTLTKTGQSTITSTITGTDTPTSLSRIFNLNGIASGPWDLIILNSDGGTVTRTFTVNSATASTVTSISPTSGVVNTSVSTTITGTGFVPGSAIIRLYRSGNYISGSVNSVGTTTQLTGTFNLNLATPGTYEVCVLPDGTETSKMCSPTFTILSSSAVNGSITIKSYPTTSKVFVSSVYKGYTPLTLDDITPGTYTVLVQRAGYDSYSESVKVTAGNTTFVTASLVLSPEETTETTTTPITTVKTVKTTAKSTAKVPTPWPTATATPASPVSFLAVIGAVGVGFMVIRK
jgi:hypothetical protein